MLKSTCTITQNHTRVSVEHLTFFGELHGATTPFNKLCTDSVFQRSEMPADDRSTHKEMLCSLFEIERFREIDKFFKMGGFHQLSPVRSS